MSFPFHDKEFTFTQPDGSQIQLKGWGDQHYAVFETLDGFTVVPDPETGFYCYATLGADGQDLEPTGVRVGRLAPRTLGLATHLRIPPAAAKRQALANFQVMESQRRCEIRRQRAKAKLRASLNGEGIMAAPPRETRRGSYVGLCLLIEFPDVPATISQAAVNDFCNQPGYRGYGNNGSVYDYFLDTSDGNLKYTNLVAPYYTAKQPVAYYANRNISQGKRARELIEEALTDLKAKGFNVDALSVDEGGYVYALNVFYAGSCPNNWAEGLWPHSWHLASPFLLAPGRSAFDYQMTNMGSELTLATFCHENGHMVCDYPDLYDYGYESKGNGHYCLMSFGGPDAKNPVEIGAYLKYKSGWASRLTPILGDIDATIDAASNDFFIYPKNQTEYFIIENRQKAGRDQGVPDAGLAIWHVDELGSNNNEQMTPVLHYESSIEQADNRFDLERGFNYGDGGDLYAAPERTEFSDTTAPSSHWWDGLPSRLRLYDIGSPGPVMHFRAQLMKDEDVQTFRQSLAPNAVIPDNTATGVRSAMHFADAAILTAIKVTVDITHTYRGDLQVILESPSGSQVMLHSRQGGRTHDLKATFDPATTPALSNLVGKPIQGDWVLLVKDLAAADTGVLNQWELELKGTKSGDGDATITADESPGVDIPDNNPTGIERSLRVDGTGPLKDIEVSVDITHTYIADLLVTLVSPTGTQVILHNRAGGALDNIIATYTLLTKSDLAAFLHQPIEGVWRLQVSDRAGLDRGKLNRWALKLTRKL